MWRKPHRDTPRPHFPQVIHRQRSLNKHQKRQRIIAHVIADFIAATLDPHLKTATIGIVLGGLIPLSLVPIFEKYVVKSKHHIVVGDHEDLKKDLEEHHH